MKLYMLWTDVARCSIVISLLALPSAVLAQTTAESTEQVSSDSTLEEIVVTAQKRSESVNRVGMSISALGGDVLVNRGVVSTEDLAKVVPGFIFSNGAYGTPNYTLRGIGYQDTSTASAPTVALYVDEVPLPFSILASVAPVDLERVEVLKGPQGTLFGQNSTAGAINYIAAKPTDVFAAGATLSYARFNDVTAQGYLSGPLSSTLKARVAFLAERSSDWQYSYTRQDTLGAKKKYWGRGTFDWDPIDKFTARLTLTAWSDDSDGTAPQFQGVRPGDARIAPIGTIIRQPIAPRNARAADWSPNREPKKDQQFYQAALRLGYELSDSVQLTSISSFLHFKRFDFVDADGTQYENLDIEQPGKTRSVYQEVRLNGDTAPIKWIVGANYSRDHVDESLNFYNRDGTAARLFPPVVWRALFAPTHHLIKTYAAFGQVEYAVSDALSLQGAIRYTKVDRDFASCTRDPGDGLSAAAWEILQARLKGAANVVDIPPGGCLTLSKATFNPVFTELSRSQDNISWRGAINWTAAPGVLLYANVSRGYKAGGYPLASASFDESYIFVNQETVLAYEAGLKASLLDRTMQVNAAGFYYDYSNKQLFGRRIDPVVGALNNYVNVPKSRVYGGEAQINWLPFRGLTTTAAVTYINTKITSSFNNFDALSRPINFKGQPFPLTPKWSWDIDAEYKADVSGSLTAFAGFHVNSRTSTNSVIGNVALFDVPGRTLLDLRAGVEGNDGEWRLQAWVTNVTNKYYWTDRQIYQDAVFQYAGAPRLYGLTFSRKW